MMITKVFFESLPDFHTYFDNLQQLFSEGKTTGTNQDEKFLNYTKLTIARTHRGLKTLVPSEDLIELVKKSPLTNWLVITEGWCGDAGNILPFIVNLANAAGNIDLRIVLRDENPEIMDLFLTNGGRAIPIFVAMDQNMNYHDHWGPRPQPAQNMVIEHKRNPEVPYEEFQIALQKWYLHDKGQTLDKELQQYFLL